MKITKFSSLIFLIACITCVHLLSLNLSKSQNKKFLTSPTPDCTKVPKARYVKVLSGEGSNKWLQISQLVVLNEKDENVAKGKDATASSVWNGSSPAYAVDGFIGSRNFPEMFHSNTENNSWFMVDLKKYEYITEIKYYNRLECCHERIVGARVQLLDENKNVVKEIQIKTSGQEIKIDTISGESYNLDDSTSNTGPKKARFVRVLGAKPGLQISQLVVLNDKDQNVAKGKPASSSSVWTGSSPSTAVDGFIGARNFPNIFHSAAG